MKFKFTIKDSIGQPEVNEFEVEGSEVLGIDFHSAVAEIIGESIQAKAASKESDVSVIELVRETLITKFDLKACETCGKLSANITKGKWPCDLTAEPYDMCNECAEDMSSEFAVWTQ